MSLCNTPQSLHTAMRLLVLSPYLLVDCEGRDIGTDGGALSIVSVGTHDASFVFFFDVLSLTATDLEPLRHLLASPSVQKVFWDGRMDAVELRRTLGVSICRPCDLQIVDINSRKPRGDLNGRKWVSIPWHPLHHVAHMDLTDVHGLIGLKSAPRVHGLSNLITNTREELPVDHEMWMNRPLPTHYLDYALKDIVLLAALYQIFSARGYMLPYHDPTLESQSVRYLNIHNAPLPADEQYLKSNLLPMEILQEPLERPARQCDKCQRWLTEQSFLFPVLLRGAMSRHTTCKVCFVLATRTEIKTRLAAEGKLSYAQVVRSARRSELTARARSCTQLHETRLSGGVSS
ncbi:ribonuclease H-like domain-containing protein [Auriculariales sp. MPI-PUGE-AT-0066]|nr:ribonuclease H-like domain-containing protein [Auriculariales sp. MPI-PUGE-AT-0066]